MPPRAAADPVSARGWFVGAWLLGCLATAAPPVVAQEAPPEFANAAEQERYESLLGELRCLVCQNQSLAESNAPLALDLRVEVLKRVRAGMTEKEIVDFLVARYGDFVLYRPPVKPGTWALWFGPFLLLGAAVLVVIRMAARGQRAAPEPIGDEERRRLDEFTRSGRKSPP
jgi:cytochrome c-type biogenesis protein CcmH